MEWITDYSNLIENIQKFKRYVKLKDEELGYYSDSISFRDTGAWLSKQEGYKYELRSKCIELLLCTKWNESDIGDGSISNAVKKSVNLSNNNLVDRNQKNHFNNQLTTDRFMKIDRAFYDLYRGGDDKKAFDEVTDIFGKKYDLIAFLFFIKDPERYLPIRSKYFDKGFKILGINFRTERKCSWENYVSYNSCIGKVMHSLNKILPLTHEASLLDAHSFIWIVINDYYGWKIDDSIIESILNEKRDINNFLEDQTESNAFNDLRRTEGIVSSFIRDSNVIKYARRCSNGVCRLCGNPAPFKDNKGEPYLEVHHIVWLSRGGYDDINNVVALCPNCHRKMHIVDDPADVETLKKSILTSQNK